VCAGGVPSLQAEAQAPRVPAWFFSIVITIFLKFINDDDDDNDDNNNSNNNF
jgi:hypothetical protein